MILMIVETTRVEVVEIDPDGWITNCVMAQKELERHRPAGNQRVPLLEYNPDESDFYL